MDMGQPISWASLSREREKQARENPHGPTPVPRSRSNIRTARRHPPAMAATTAPASQPSSQQPPPPTAETVLSQASRDPSAAAAHLPELPPDALVDILSTLSAASPADHLALLPLSPSPSAASAALAALLSAPTWPSATLLAVASLLRDLPPAYRSRVPAFLGKILSLLPGADAQDLPTIAYQLLLLASKPLQSRAGLAGLLRFFGSFWGARVRAPTSIARLVEGSVC